MNRTRIEWVKNPDGTPGYTWNPITGCLNSCPYCYARKLANTRLVNVYSSGTMTAPGYSEPDPFYPRFWPDRLDDPLRLSKPSGIFVCDMGDLFGVGIPEEWTREVMDAIRATPQHRYYLLTKQPQNLAQWSPFPANCWVGVSVDGTDNAPLHRALYRGMDCIEAQIKFLRIEPLLADIHLDQRDLEWTGVNWIVIGAQTKPLVLPQLEWVEDIIRAADEARVPVFLQNSLEPLLSASSLKRPWAFRDGYYLDDDHAGFDRQLRQEMPK